MSLELAPGGTVTAIESSSVTPNARARRFYGAYRDAQDHLREALRSAKVIAPFGRAHEDKETPIGKLFQRLVGETHALRTFWETRTRKAESVLRTVLASEALCDEQRQTILSTLYGRRGTRRNSHILSEAERCMIDHYRQMPAVDRQMIRTLFARVAESTTRDTSCRRPDEDES